MSDAPPTDADATGHKVFAGNLAYAVTDESLKAFFAPVASDIVSAQVITRGTRSAGYGFVTVKTLDAAQKACEHLDKKELEGRQVVIEIAKPAEQKDKERAEKRATRRAGRPRGRAPPGEVTEEEASGEMEKQDVTGTTEDGQAKRKNKKKRVNRKKTKAATEGDEAAPVAIEKAPAATTDIPHKKTPRPAKEKRPPRPAGEDPAGEPSTTVLFVANLGFNIDDAGLSDLFTSAGIKVISARVVRRRWGKPRKSKGYGFVDVGGEEEQKKAITALQGKEIEGREIAVKVAVNANQDDEDAHAANGNGGSAGAKESSPETTILAQ